MRAATRFPMVLATLLLAGPACDGTNANFLNAVPIPDEVESTHVILGIDGLSRAVYDGAHAAGAFSGWSDADLITVFPGTSDYAWTRTLHAAPLPSYEVEYYDPAANRLVNHGLIALVEHPVQQGIADVMPCYQRFDFLGDGELWMIENYADAEGSLPSVLDAMFATIQARARQRQTVLGYLINIDVMSHQLPLERSVAALVEVERRIRDFQQRHQPGRYRFTILGDHGNTHRPTTLVDLEEAMVQVGVAPVEALGDGSRLEAVPILDARVSYLPLHARPAQVPEASRRLSTHPWIEFAIAPLGAATTTTGEPARRYGLWHGGARLEFVRSSDGAIVEVADGAGWRALGVDLGADGLVRLTDADSFERTRKGRWPDLFARIDDGFTDPAARVVADLMVSFTDDYAAIGFRLPGRPDAAFTAGFHGSLSRDATLSVLATQTGPLPAAVRAGDVVQLFPELGPR